MFEEDCLNLRETKVLEKRRLQRSKRVYEAQESETQGPALSGGKLYLQKFLK